MRFLDFMVEGGIGGGGRCDRFLFYNFLIFFQDTCAIGGVRKLPL